MYISLVEFFIVFYLLIEQYVFESIQSYQTNSESKHSFFEMVEQLDVEDCKSEQEVHPLVPINSEEEDVKVAQVSELDDGAMDLLTTLESEFSMDKSTNEVGYHGEYMEHSDADCPPLWIEHEIDGLIVEDDDCLSINDINVEEHVTIPETKYDYKTAKIKEKLYGSQQWIVSVIGKEVSYLHVSDGERAWINIGIDEARKVSKGDVLLLDIRREENGIQVDRFITLETSVSDDYVIPDEEIYLDSERSDRRIAI
ncbi:hypothetical protein NC797_07670 [Aquibacillus sp. 3ASR75-11]|uniref:Uncharacterized protein n=1 Tax=Terrihalobacillus insolitus TaxID=2950438 RepID=A0A9X3WW23_9BACI|nr:hypothetical protein [Terrihalobacillus insolitus]MDC3424384.1 hypothetical protein [Terrihalobacillus insolitus]